MLVPDPGIRRTDRSTRAISAHCHDATDGGERVCCEEVVLTVRGEAAGHLSGIVAPLLIHDLPTHVWWPGDPPFRDPIFDQVVDLGDRVLVDSADFSDLLRRDASGRGPAPPAAASATSAGSASAWWQELTAQFFDAPRFRRYLPNLSRLRIRYAVRARADDAGPTSPSPMSQALLYAGWIATRLGWKRHRTVTAAGAAAASA